MRTSSGGADRLKGGASPAVPGGMNDSKIKAYIPDDELVWVGVEIVSEGPAGIYTVDVIDEEYTVYPRTKTINIKDYPYLKALPLQNAESDNLSNVGVDDMIVLNYLHEPSILDNLRRRFMAQIPYTYTGEICVAINPYKWLPLYTTELREAYALHLRHELKPHVYAISSTAYQGLSKYGRNQSILVSGESGAGKTETVKILMSHLASISGRRNSEVIEKVLQANPLMETFGNAKTTRNDNSSRFGKFTRLQFDEVNLLAGSKCVTYLLEKSRVVNQNRGERNYHIFHQLFCAPEHVKASLRLEGLSAVDFLYSNAGDVETKIIEGVSDGDRFLQTMETLSLLGVDEFAQNEILRVIAGVLFLGEIYFQGDLDASHVDQQYWQNVVDSCDLLGLDEMEFCKRVTTRKIEAEGRETVIQLSRDQAFDSRDALAKDVYDKLFKWLVFVLNQSTAADEKSLNCRTEKLISLLDIFGFETFEVNRFEQLCINFANEKLQQKFTKDIFQAVQQEYRDEGLQWESIGYKDNSDVLELFEGKLGVIALLNEECLMPNGNDSNYVSKLHSSCKQHPCFSVLVRGKKDEFVVFHFAGQVSYSVAAFVERNRDAVPAELTSIMAESSLPLVRDCYSETFFASWNEKLLSPSSNHRLTPSRNGASPFKTSIFGSSSRKQSFMKADTVTTKFRGQLDQLMTEIGMTTVQYVRCIKPNALKSSGVFDRPMVRLCVICVFSLSFGLQIVNQLRCAGMIEAIRISRAAYPYRVTHSEFLSRFAQLRPRLYRRLKDLQSPGEQCFLLLSDIWPNQTYLGPSSSAAVSGLSNKAYEVGKTKVSYF
jgi:myosin-5